MTTVRSIVPARPPTEFATLLEALARPEAFAFPLEGDRAIDVIQTHASAVLLAGDRAYKLKKPKDFGFFDYSTPALRRHFCVEEVRLNARLAPSVYLGVAPVLAQPDGRVRFGATLPATCTPEPGTTVDEGTVVDYAVVMVRLPEEATLQSLVQADASRQVLTEVLTAVAHQVAAFHAATYTNRHIARFGARDVIAENWEENFRQMRPYRGHVLDAAAYDRITDYVHRFLAARAALFASRVRARRIRDCHGDLRLQHIYVLGPTDTPGEQLAIVDCIEFNERFRYGDVTGEVAFLAMELDAAGHPDLSRAFVNAYVAETGDNTLRELLPFYMCYRACVRGKVLALQSDELEVPQAQREAALEQASALFGLADRYASGPTTPSLVLVGGLMGTGKSTLAQALHRQLGYVLCSSDTTRKRLAQLDPAQPQAVDFGRGLYSADWTVRTYHTMLKEAHAALDNGRSVLLDATFSRRADRQAAAHLAAAHRAKAVFLECVCPREVALQRLAQRWSARTVQSKQTRQEASVASDGRPALYDAQRATWEPFDADAEPGVEHIVFATILPLAGSVGSALQTLGVP